MRSSPDTDNSSITGSFVRFSTAAVDIPARSRAQTLWTGAPLMGSGSTKEFVMKAGAFRSAATWLAAMFVGTMFVAASTSFAHVL